MQSNKVDCYLDRNNFRKKTHTHTYTHPIDCNIIRAANTTKPAQIDFVYFKLKSCLVSKAIKAPKKKNNKYFVFNEQQTLIENEFFMTIQHWRPEIDSLQMIVHL